jgi:hypothetical protein
MVTRFLSPPLTPRTKSFPTLDAHYPQLAVGDTLYFAALARTPREIPGGMSREELDDLAAKVFRHLFRGDALVVHVGRGVYLKPVGLPNNSVFWGPLARAAQPS